MNYLRALLSISFLGLFLPNVVLGSSHFLTLPMSNGPKLMQGWYYTSNFGGLKHQGIDYYSPIGGNIYASSGGCATRYKQLGANRAYGNFVVIDHGNGYKTLYAHMSYIDSSIQKNTKIERGQIIGKSGMSGTDNPHLHYEALSASSNSFGLNRGYGWRVDPYDLYKTSSYYPPNKNAKNLGANHLWLGSYPEPWYPINASTLTVTNTDSRYVQASWTKIDSDKFDHYDLYRSGVEGGTSGSGRNLVFKSSDPNVLSYVDSPPVGANYYRLVVYYKNGLSAESEEKTVSTAYEIELIDDKYGIQTRPMVWDGKIFWNDPTEPTSGVTHSITYYDISTKSKVVIPVIGTKSHAPMSSTAGAGYYVFTAQQTGTNNGYNVYGTNLDTLNSFIISDVARDEQTPSISEEGIVVWADPRNASYDIYMLDLNKSIGPVPLVTMEGTDQWPIISGRNVVWSRSGKSGLYHDLWLTSIDGGGESMIEEDIDHYYFDISGDDVVYIKNDDVWHYSIATGTKKLIADTITARDPRTRDGKGVYVDEGKIHLFDLAASTDQIVPTGDLEVYYPFILGYYLVFNAIKPGTTSDYDVYLIRL